MGTSFDGCELSRSDDEAEETASSPLHKPHYNRDNLSGRRY